MRLVLPIIVLACGTAAAQPAAPDPDWPCQQHLIPTLQAGSYWTGPAVKTDDYSWHDDEKLTALVENAVDRDTPDDEAKAALAAYSDAIPQDQRTTALPRLFGALVNETNDERGLVIARIQAIAHRQHELGDVIAKLSDKAEAIPASATGDAATRRADLAGERDLDTSAFQATQHTIRYACEIPGVFDRRLGAFARVLAEKLKP